MYVQKEMTSKSLFVVKTICFIQFLSPEKAQCNILIQLTYRSWAALGGINDSFISSCQILYIDRRRIFPNNPYATEFILFVPTCGICESNLASFLLNMDIFGNSRKARFTRTRNYAVCLLT